MCWMADRIVLVIDLQPLTEVEDPNPYLNSILTTSKSILLSKPLSKSLSSFTLFFSSLSPSLSPNLPLSPPFSPPLQTLHTLSHTLLFPLSSPSLSSLPRASHIVGSLFRITRLHTWVQNIRPGNRFDNVINSRSNLVLLFSPVAKSADSISRFINDDEDEDKDEVNNLSGNAELLRRKFHDVFTSVNGSFVRRDIQCSWIDVENDGREDVKDEFFKSCVRNLGWGFFSSESIVLGSVLVPFELVYPLFGYTLNYLNLIDDCKRIRTQLFLEISNVGRQTVECNYCDLELFCLKDTTAVSDVKMVRFSDLEIKAQGQDESVSSCFNDGIKKIQIKSVRKCRVDARDICASDFIIVRGDYTKENSKGSGERPSCFFADRVLEDLSSDKVEFVCTKDGPTWQLILSFLCRNGYEAVVTIISRNRDSFTALLKPFTVHLALLFMVNDWNRIEIDNRSKLMGIDGELTENERLPATNSLSLVDEKRIREKLNVYKDLTWTTFRKSAFELTSLELEEAYFYRKLGISRKLKFLRSWIKQVNKCSNSCFTSKEKVVSCEQTKIDTRVRQVSTEDNRSQPNPSYSLTEPSKIQDLVVFVGSFENSESFFDDLPKKIKDGLESEGADLQILAERLVNLSTYWLSQKKDTCSIVANEAFIVTPDESHGTLVADLVKVLLKDPKDLKDKAKENGSLIAASDPSLAVSASENIVREHELQIFFRMEILRLKVADSIEASTKRKFVKQICALLEIIQFLVEGGFHSNLTLFGYVEKIIKTRYFHVLEDVVNKIYTRMDLLPIAYEDQSPIFQFNSEDSNHYNSYRNELSSGELDSSKTEVDYLQEDISKDDNSRKLSGVQGRREKASRYLQRVWAPKQVKGMTVKSEPMRKQTKRKERSKRKADVVCETPNFDKKCDSRDQFFASVSKALFQDDL